MTPHSIIIKSVINTPFIIQTPLPDSRMIGIAERNHQMEKMSINHGSTKQLNELIDHKCRQIGKTKASKGSAIHLAEWMKSQLGNTNELEEDDYHVQSEPEPEIWSQEEFKKRSTQLNVAGIIANRSESRCEDVDVVSERSLSRNTERSHQSVSTSESQTTVKSNHAEKTVSVCRECHKTCLNSDEKRDFESEDDYDDNWGGPLSMMSMCGIFPPSRSPLDPFTPAEPPTISVLPPTPDNKPKNRNWESDINSVNNNYISCGGEKCYDSCKILSDISFNSSTVPTIKKPHIKISEVIEGDDSEETPDGSLLSDEPPYKSLSSSGLRRFGTMNSLERVGSDDPLEEDDKTEEDVESDKEEDDDTTLVRTYPPEVSHSIRGWTARAGCFVAEKMAFFERLSSPDNTKTVRKTTFFERYLKPSGDNHLDSPPDPGTNTSSSGRGEEEGETSGATSGEEVWGTPTSGGEVEEELAAESSALSFIESPHGSLIGTDDDTEQLMEDLLISLPMLAARPPGLPPRRRLEPLLEEDDTESTSTPCSPKLLHDFKTTQDRGSNVSQVQNHDNNTKLATSSADRPLSGKKETSGRLRIGTIDRALGIHSDEENEDEQDDSTTTPSLLHRLGLRRNRDDCSRKSNRLLGFLRGRKVEATYTTSNSAAYGGKPLFKYLFNKDTVDDIPTTFPNTYNYARPNDKQLERRFWKQLRRRRNSSLMQSGPPQVAV